MWIIVYLSIGLVFGVSITTYFEILAEPIQLQRATKGTHKAPSASIGEILFSIIACTLFWPLFLVLFFLAP